MKWPATIGDCEDVTALITDRLAVTLGVFEPDMCSTCNRYGHGQALKAPNKCVRSFSP
jgi:hypothetical protein